MIIKNGKRKVVQGKEMKSLFGYHLFFVIDNWWCFRFEHENDYLIQNITIFFKEIQRGGHVGLKILKETGIDLYPKERKIFVGKKRISI